LGISNNEPGALCVVQNEKKIQFLSSRILPHRATVSTFVCKAVCTILASSSQKLAEKKKYVDHSTRHPKDHTYTYLNIKF